MGGPIVTPCNISLPCALNLEAGCGEEFVEVEPEFFEERLFGVASHMLKKSPFLGKLFRL